MLANDTPELPDKTLPIIQPFWALELDEIKLTRINILITLNISLYFYKKNLDKSKNNLQDTKKMKNNYSHQGIKKLIWIIDKA
ncbi:MAG: hypothetical protein ACK4K0_03475 [Flavobacteriales bacterium]